MHPERVRNGKQHKGREMKLSEVKDWINGLPKEFLDFDVVNAEEGDLDDGYTYRLDKPLIALNVDEDSKEVLLINDKVTTEIVTEDEK